MLEGEILPPKAGVAIEGPFGEMGGYYGDASPASLIKIHAVLFRDNPIIMGSPPFPNTARNLFGARGLRVRSELEALGIPGIKGVRYGGGIVVLSIEQSFPGHAMRAALGALGGTGGYHTRFVILVDEDVDPHNLGEVFEAMGSRCDPGTSIDINRRIWSSRVDPRLEPEKSGKGRLYRIGGDHRRDASLPLEGALPGKGRHFLGVAQRRWKKSGVSYWVAEKKSKTGKHQNVIWTVVSMKSLRREFDETSVKGKLNSAMWPVSDVRSSFHLDGEGQDGGARETFRSPLPLSSPSRGGKWNSRTSVNRTRTHRRTNSIILFS